MKYKYITPDVTAIRLEAVRTVQLSADKDNDWYEEELPEDDETELL